MGRNAWIAVASVAMLVALAYAASPWLAVYKIRAAARSGDRDQLEQVIDFASVRESLKAQLSTVMRKVMEEYSKSDSPVEALGGMLISVWTDRLVDGAITPDGAAGLLRNGKVGAPRSSGKDSDDKATWSSSYRTMDRFRMELKSHAAEPVRLTLDRRGFMSWKVVRIEIPPELFANVFDMSALDRPSPSSDPVPNALTSVAMNAGRENSRIRSQIVEGFTLADGWKTAISESFENTGKWPTAMRNMKENAIGNSKI